MIEAEADDDEFVPQTTITASARMPSRRESGVGFHVTDAFICAAAGVDLGESRLSPGCLLKVTFEFQEFGENFISAERSCAEAGGRIPR